MRTLLYVLAAALLAAPAASAGGFYESFVLEPAASYVAKKPVKVWCAKTAASWHSFMLANYGTDDGAHGSTLVGSSEMHLDTEECPPIRQAIAGQSVYFPTLAATIQILTHESIHARGERDEGVTDCDAMHEMPGVAVRFFRIKAGKQLRELMASAWAYHREAPPEYRTVC